MQKLTTFLLLLIAFNAFPAVNHVLINSGTSIYTNTCPNFPYYWARRGPGVDWSWQWSVFTGTSLAPGESWTMIDNGSGSGYQFRGYARGETYGPVQDYASGATLYYYVVPVPPCYKTRISLTNLCSLPICGRVKCYGLGIDSYYGCVPPGSKLDLTFQYSFDFNRSEPFYVTDETYGRVYGPYVLDWELCSSSSTPDASGSQFNQGEYPSERLTNSLENGEWTVQILTNYNFRTNTYEIPRDFFLTNNFLGTNWQNFGTNDLATEQTLRQVAELNNSQFIALGYLDDTMKKQIEATLRLGQQLVPLLEKIPGDTAAGFQFLTNWGLIVTNELNTNNYYVTNLYNPNFTNSISLTNNFTLTNFFTNNYSITNFLTNNNYNSNYFTNNIEVTNNITITNNFGDTNLYFTNDGHEQAFKDVFASVYQMTNRNDTLVYVGTRPGWEIVLPKELGTVRLFDELENRIYPYNLLIRDCFLWVIRITYIFAMLVLAEKVLDTIGQYQQIKVPTVAGTKNYLWWWVKRAAFLAVCAGGACIFESILGGNGFFGYGMGIFVNEVLHPMSGYEGYADEIVYLVDWIFPLYDFLYYIVSFIFFSTILLTFKTSINAYLKSIPA